MNSRVELAVLEDILVFARVSAVGKYSRVGCGVCVHGMSGRIVLYGEQIFTAVGRRLSGVEQRIIHILCGSISIAEFVGLVVLIEGRLGSSHRTDTVENKLAAVYVSVCLVVPAADRFRTEILKLIFRC